MRTRLRPAILVILASIAMLVMVPAARAADLTFTEVADSAADGFDAFSAGCAAINGGGDITFGAGRLASDGFNTIPGIYRANADGTLTTIVENAKRYRTIGLNPSINDAGVVSFAARVDGGKKPDTEAILRGEGGKLTTIASTAGIFNFFGFDTSINDLGEVAFKAELDEAFGFDEGLFSGSGTKAGVTTHYLASTSIFDGDDSRPTINDAGDIAFRESVSFDGGIFAGQEGTFETIGSPDPDVFVDAPTYNEAGTAAFRRSFFDEANQVFVDQIVTGDGGPLQVVADTTGAYREFGFRPPSINGSGEVAFLATLDDGTSGIFTGPDPTADLVIATGASLDGATVTGLKFCEEGLSDSGTLTFIAFFDAPETPEGMRFAVYRATSEA